MTEKKDPEFKGPTLYCPRHGIRELTIKNVRNHITAYVCDVEGCERLLRYTRM